MRNHTRILLFLTLIAVVFSSASLTFAMGKRPSEKLKNVIIKPPETLKFVDGPPSLPKGVQMVIIQGNPKKRGLFTMQLKFPKNYAIPPHWHPEIEHVTVLSGDVYFAVGNTLNRRVGTKISQGGVFIIPPKKTHFAYTKSTPAIIQLHSMGPWAITYVNAKDDPRR